MANSSSSEQSDANEWWNEIENENENENENDKENSRSQSSMSLSHTLPSVQALQLANYSTANSEINNNTSKYSTQSAVTPTTNNTTNIQTTDDDTKSQSHNNSIYNTSPITESKDESKTTDNTINIIYDNKNFSKFKKTYKYNKKDMGSHKNTTIGSSNASILKITSHKELDLCFKEMTIGCNAELKRCVNEYKSLKRFYSVYYAKNGLNTDNMVALYVNKKKGSDVWPKKVRLVMKYHEGEDLDDNLVDEDGSFGFFYEDDFRAIMKKILYQLQICHDQGIIHCDLKPNNIRFVIFCPFLFNQK